MLVNVLINTSSERCRIDTDSLFVCNRLHKRSQFALLAVFVVMVDIFAAGH